MYVLYNDKNVVHGDDEIKAKKKYNTTCVSEYEYTVAGTVR